MDLLGARVTLNPQPAPEPSAALEVAMLGHCPGVVRRSRLLALPETLAEMRRQGLGARVDAIEAGADETLYHLPIPLYSVAEFDDIFPAARTGRTRYQSLLAGDRAWLPGALDDFFANGGQKLWLVRLPEAEGVAAFTDFSEDRLLAAEALRGLEAVMTLRPLGLIAMPDLERLQIPARLPDIPRKRLANPEPCFVPCATELGDDHRERRYPAELVDNRPRQPLVPLLRNILGPLARHRPDIQCLLTLPLDLGEGGEGPAADPEALDALEAARRQSGAHLLRPLQLLFPYLRPRPGALFSPVGLVAGAVDRSARQRGVWRSVGRVPLASDSRLFPSLDTRQALALRDSPGVGLLRKQAGALSLDDERTLVPALHRNSYQPGSDRARSGEVVRFMGFLQRQLQALGERLVFDVDYRDPRPRVVLEQFLLRLYRAGALRGRAPEEAFRVRREPAPAGTLAYAIEVAPAYPIDRLTLTFINRDGYWRAAAEGGSR